MPVRQVRTPKIEYREKFNFDPDDHDTKEKSFCFIEHHCKTWLRQVLAPVMWGQVNHNKGKKNLAKLRLEFRKYGLISNKC